MTQKSKCTTKLQQTSYGLSKLPQSWYIPHSRCRTLHPNHQITTDASCTGGGAILSAIGESTVTWSLAWPWITAYEPNNMAVAELRAIVIGLANAPLHDTTVQILTDNQTAYFAVKNLHSHSEPLNSTLQLFFNVVTSKKLLYAIAWIQTENNPADKLTRKFENLRDGNKEKFSMGLGRTQFPVRS